MKKEGKADQGIPLGDAYKLMHELNKGITYGKHGNVNARDLETLKTETPEQWQRVRKEYKEWRKQMEIFSNGVIIGIAVIALIAFLLYFSDGGYIRSGAGIILAVCLLSIAKRAGHEEGYIDGYDTGFNEGVDKGLGITPEESIEASQRATDMEIEEVVVRKLDEKE